MFVLYSSIELSSSRVTMRFFVREILLVLFLGFEAFGQECIVKNFTEVPNAIANCDNIVLDSLRVPGGQVLALPLRDGTTLKFRGHTIFEYAAWEGPLVVINGTNVTIEGETDELGQKSSVLDGQGPLYWDGQGEWGTLKPTFFTIQLHNSVMRNIYVLNTPKHGVLLADSSHVNIYNWEIDNMAGDVAVAGKDKAGHNTDGFDIWNGTNIVLRDTDVYNQDDCVAIRCGDNILVENFLCLGGHGLSLSVGFSNDSIALNTLLNVVIRDSVLAGGENAIHIKTHIDAGQGLLRNITYSNIVLYGMSRYGINIQQNYRNMPSNSTFPSEPRNNIPIKDLHLENIVGTVAGSAVPIYILCAQEGCSDWDFDSVLVAGTKSNSCNYVPEGFSC